MNGDDERAREKAPEKVSQDCDVLVASALRFAQRLNETLSRLAADHDVTCVSVGGAGSSYAPPQANRVRLVLEFPAREKKGESK